MAKKTKITLLIGFAALACELRLDNSAGRVRAS